MRDADRDLVRLHNAKQRAGLPLSNGLLYVGFGGDNQKNLAGWLFVFDASTLAMKTVWSLWTDLIKQLC
jgi:hypothetical protein